MTESVLDALLAAAAGHAGGQPSEALVTAANAYFGQVREDAGLVARTALALADVPPMGAAFVAHMLGNVAEVDGQAERAFPALWTLFVDWAALLAEGPQPLDRAARGAAVAQALDLLAPSIVSHLASLPARRDALRADGVTMPVLEVLQNEHNGACWILEALRKNSASLLVLHPATRSGWRARYENVSLCFHLFSLLQCAVGTRIEGGREPDAAVAAAATGTGGGPGGTGDGGLVHDQAWWHYGHALAPAREIGGSIWGEATADQIPVVDGHQVIVLWAPILQGRSWNSSFFTPHLQQMPASFTLGEPLAPQECDAWISRLKIEIPAEAPQPRETTPAAASVRAETPKAAWWKFWR